MVSNCPPPELTIVKGRAAGCSWSSPLLPNAFARAFAPLPSGSLWQWADDNVWLESQEAAEAGPYRSSKTPWTRRLQDLAQRRVMHCYDFTLGRWVAVQVTEVNFMKSSQSGVTEACLNVIRYRANFRPCNVIYSVDTRETAADISKRLKPSLEKLDSDVFTGDDADVGTFVMRLRGMNVWFQGSFSSGKFASKMAPLVINDEVEEHGVMSDNASTVKQASSRKKTADDGLMITLCKPKKKKGPIHRAYLRGNQERLHISCPHCGRLQPFTFFREEINSPFEDQLVDVTDEQTGEVVARLPLPLPLGHTRKVKTGRIVFSHCKDLLNNWDELRILNETYYECGNDQCKGKIEEFQKLGLVAEAVWLPTAHGTPGIVSQHINDLYSEDRNSRWGMIVLEYLNAKKDGRRELQGFHNDRLGLAWTDEQVALSEEDVRKNIAVGTNGCVPYKRGYLPFLTYPNAAVLIMGSDIGGNYGRWSVSVVAPNLEDHAVVDWGEELDPDAIVTLVLQQRWPLQDRPDRKFGVSFCFIDAKYRKRDVYRAALRGKNGLIIPVAGIGGSAARVSRLWSYSQIPSYRKGFKRLSYNDREAKDALYIDGIKKGKPKVWFPQDVVLDPKFMSEMTKEELLEDADTGETKWKDKPGANHYGDCVKNTNTGLMFITRKQRGEDETDDGSGGDDEE